MKKYIFFLLVGVSLLSCKNEIREQYIRGYYDCKLAADSIQMEVDAYQAKYDSLSAIMHSSPETFDEFMLVSNALASAIESHTRMLEFGTTYLEWADNAKKIGDRNYFKIYEKQLKEEGRIK